MRGGRSRYTTFIRRVFLSGQVPPLAARAILHTEAEGLNALLTAIGPDRDPR